MFRPWSAVLDLIYPPVCAGCGTGRPDTGEILCWDCRRTLPVIGHPFCATCGRPVHGRVDHEFVCQDCTEAPPAYHRARAAVLYKQFGQRLIIDYKYHAALWTEPLLLHLAETCVRTHFPELDFEFVCAVPLHSVKRRQRGFNQAALIARGLGRRLGRPVMPEGVLRRVRLTATQTRLTAGQRHTNVMGAFEVARPGRIAGKKVLLVDDVMTTGATASACAAVLSTAGAARVDVVTVARGI